jgi:hypothetical protein
MPASRTRGSVAQSVEHWTFNPLVVGSIPTRPTIFNDAMIVHERTVIPQRALRRSLSIGNNEIFLRGLCRSTECVTLIRASRLRISPMQARPWRRQRCVMVPARMADR